MGLSQTHLQGVATTSPRRTTLSVSRRPVSGADLVCNHDADYLGGRAKDPWFAGYLG